MSLGGRLTFLSHRGAKKICTLSYKVCGSITNSCCPGLVPQPRAARVSKSARPGAPGTQLSVVPRNNNFLFLRRPGRAGRHSFSSVPVPLFDAQELDVSAGRQGRAIGLRALEKNFRTMGGNRIEPPSDLAAHAPKGRIPDRRKTLVSSSP
jgi:hypothetical protein